LFEATFLLKMFHVTQQHYLENVSMSF